MKSRAFIKGVGAALVLVVASSVIGVTFGFAMGYGVHAVLAEAR